MQIWRLNINIRLINMWLSCLISENVLYKTFPRMSVSLLVPICWNMRSVTNLLYLLNVAIAWMENDNSLSYSNSV